MSILDEAFELLPPSSRKGSVVGQEVREGIWVCRAELGQPVLLINHEQTGQQPGIRLRHIEVDFGLNCSIELAQGPISGVFLGVTCRSDDVTVRRLFWHAVQSLVHLVNQGSSPADLEMAVHALVRVFSDRPVPMQKDIIGFMGELVYLLILSDIPGALLAWHSDPYDPWDFVFTGLRVDVKATIGMERKHHLTENQAAMEPQTSRRSAFASVRLLRSDLGADVWGLVELVAAECAHSPYATAKLLKQVQGTVGTSSPSGELIRIDVVDSRESVLLYEAKSVPRLPQPYPQGVESVSYRSDFALAELYSL